MQLNLARKWRSRCFEELIGQPLVVRTLKNSLYRDLIFPVYLLSGTRGCGKTSIARIFASAINCEQYNNFKSQPQKIVLPCLNCKSCKAMLALNHPDFIEIDAASHTGVDNIRQISEAASFVPAMSQKKIYLIDEAHMLSKAAFNAFLKLLEEPPTTACFLLATTEVNKIPSTVRSRCLQLFFYPVNCRDLVQYLSFICDKEKITYEKEALLSISVEAEGSVRDALNLIERIRLVSTKITLDAVSQVLGSISNHELIVLVKLLLKIDDDALFKLLDEQLIKIQDSIYFFRRISQLILFITAIKKKIVPVKDTKDSQYLSDFFIYLDDELKELISRYPLTIFVEFIDLVIHYESLLAKTIQWQLIIKVLFLKFLNCLKEHQDKFQNNNFDKNSKNLEEFAKKQKNNTENNLNRVTKKMQNFLKKDINIIDEITTEISDLNILKTTDKNNNENSKNNLSNANIQNNINNFNDNNNSKKLKDTNILGNFIKALEQKHEVLLSSIFAQVTQANFEENKLNLYFEQHLSFYKDTLNNSILIWQSILNETFNQELQVNFLFTKETQSNLKKNFMSDDTNNKITKLESDANLNKINLKDEERKQIILNKNLKHKTFKLDLNDSKDDNYKFSRLLLQIFPGNIKILDA